MPDVLEPDEEYYRRKASEEQAAILAEALDDPPPAAVPDVLATDPLSAAVLRAEEKLKGIVLGYRNISGQQALDAVKTTLVDLRTTIWDGFALIDDEGRIGYRDPKAEAIVWIGTLLPYPAPKREPIGAKP